jgi:cytochrome c-type biogenesis protein CcmF
VFKSWTVLLAIAAFSLSLLGTFLVRSGVLTSVHAFAADPSRGMFILIFLLFVVGGSLTLFALRAPVVKSQVGFALWSRETLLLANNLVLVVAASMILLGTLYPLVLDALTGAKLSVGPPYFNALFMPLMALLMLVMASAWWCAGRTPRQMAGEHADPGAARQRGPGGGGRVVGDFDWPVLGLRPGCLGGARPACATSSTRPATRA